MRTLLVIHRYLAVAVGLLMTLWCLSGFVMMYQGFPELSSQQRLQGLAALELDVCCELPDDLPPDDAAPGSFRIEMLLGEPVLRLGGGADGPAALYLTSGEPVSPLSVEQVTEVARLYARGNELDAAPRALGIIAIDQWTLQSARRNQPAWHVALEDSAGTEIYINGTSGEVFQQTNRRERLLSWFGAIPHWLYPTVLRQNGPLWTEIVVWTSVLGSFLAATGLYVGIARLRRNTGTGKVGSPYKGGWYWHHISGLVFGVLVLTWVFSGLMTMNPWGALSSAGGGDYRAQITGAARWSELRQFLQTIDTHAVTAEEEQWVQIVPAVFASQLYLLAHQRGGASVRLNSQAQSAPLAVSELDALTAGLGTPVLEAGLLYNEDSYYYGHKREVSLPVYRVILDDGEQTRLYINPETGSVRTLGSTGRWSRWIRTGLHDLDFPVLRVRPVWDIVVIVLLIGVTGVCVTGTWMALRRVRRDFKQIRRPPARQGVRRPKYPDPMIPG